MCGVRSASVNSLGGNSLSAVILCRLPNTMLISGERVSLSGDRSFLAFGFIDLPYCVLRRLFSISAE